MYDKMLYLNTRDVERMGIDWTAVIEVINASVKALADHDFVQPIKPYLRYKDPGNRIIAMPAYLGAGFSFAGIKWIASFPGNFRKGLPRAHSVTILNHPDTGVPLCMLNTTLISGVRTAGVSGAVVKAYLRRRPAHARLSVGISGFGPIGKLHLEMVASVLDSQLDRVFLYDIRGIDSEEIPAALRSKVIICDEWERAYHEADIFITCTVSKHRYIDQAPKAGSLQLNVSLRDYVPEYKEWVDIMIVDDWEEVCRENTDVEVMHNRLGLQKENTYSLVDVLVKDRLRSEKERDVWMFNPMGMAVFDIGVGSYYYKLARERSIGTPLE